MTMKRILNSITLMILCASTCLLTANFVMAQTEGSVQAQDSKESNSPETTTCPAAQTFTYGSGAQKFAFCISTHGNVLQLESPANFRHISTREGYAVCSSLTEVSESHGYDAGSSESGWGVATASQPGGANTLPLSITRNTTDGKFQLKQSFEWNTAEKEIIITMVLKNTSASSIMSVQLSRYFDGDISDTPGNDVYDTTQSAAWGRDTSLTRYGLMLTALSFAYTSQADQEPFNAWNPTGSTYQSARGCYSFIGYGPPPPASDYIGRLTYTLGTISAGQSKTVKMLYKRF
jgi:hypothetical protein